MRFAGATATGSSAWVPAGFAGPAGTRTTTAATAHATRMPAPRAIPRSRTKGRGDRTRAPKLAAVASATVTTIRRFACCAQYVG